MKELNKKILSKEFLTIETFMKSVPKKYKINPRKDVMIQVYQQLISSGTIIKTDMLDEYFIKLPIRSWSGVLVVTIVLRPDKFSCPYDCKFCPNETKANGALVDMPRSYLSSEPAVMRAMSVDFNIVEQFKIRVNTLRKNGHVIDKVEIIVLGGTFSSYPREYQNEAMRDIFYAANIYESTSNRKKQSLKQEQFYNNDSSKIKIIGISLETRPDQINNHELRRFREYGCTRIQIGVQHTDDSLLKIVNRKHDTECSIKAIKLMKDYGFKVDIHVMPDLPGATPEKDKKMLEMIFLSDKFCPDYVKIYPCLDVTYTEIRNWKKDGRWKPYSELNCGKELIELLLYAKKHLIPKWVRINRIQRDFPKEHNNNEFKGFLSDTHMSNLRQILDDRMYKEGFMCLCIRCREIKKASFKTNKVFINKIEYNASNGREIFLSIDTCKSSKKKENQEDKLLGFIRLRLPKPSIEDSKHFIPALRGASLIRELHVYGGLKKVNQYSTKGAQHHGFGKKLVMLSEIISWKNGYKRIAIISGVGVRNYYKKMGYELHETYMIKHLNIYSILTNIFIILYNTCINFVKQLFLSF
jgi:ELP3 family radical SAM enzyme/protein acetyltransferase